MAGQPGTCLPSPVARCPGGAMSRSWTGGWAAGPG